MPGIYDEDETPSGSYSGNVYHYTDAKGFEGIKKSKRIEQSTRETVNNGFGPWYGSGIYFTTASPYSGTRNILKQNYDFNFVKILTKNYGKTEYAFEIHSSSLKQFEKVGSRGRSVYICRLSFIDLNRISCVVYRRHIFHTSSLEFPYECQVTRVWEFVGSYVEPIRKPLPSTPAPIIAAPKNPAAERLALSAHRKSVAQAKALRLREDAAAAKHVTSDRESSNRRGSSIRVTRLEANRSTSVSVVTPDRPEDSGVNVPVASTTDTVIDVEENVCKSELVGGTRKRKFIFTCFAKAIILLIMIFVGLFGTKSI